jgi:molecular chaperone DnaK
MRTYGIDLGTTTSAIGVVDRGVPKLFTIDGSELLPSAVAFDPGGVEVGQPALNRLLLHPDRVIVSSKRDMGTDRTWKVDGRAITPVDVAEQILRRLVAAVGEPVSKVVITVPAWFTAAQRADTKRAGERAGLEVARIINEPTAAALAHAHGRARRATVLVYDFGGGTFDVSVVRQDADVVEVLASHGDSRLGGDDVDAALVRRILERISQTDADLAHAIEASRPTMVKLARAAEAAKVGLANDIAHVVRVPYLLEREDGPFHLEMAFSREDLDDVVAPLIKRTFTSVDQVLADANLTARDIDELILVGGTTLLPQVWQMLHDRYGLEGSHAIPPRRAVALGAAIQGAILDGSRVDGVLVDVTPYALSIGAAGGGIPGFPTNFACETITPRNTQLPSRHVHLMYTNHPDQPSLSVPVYQGSNRDPRQNLLLGEIFMDDIPPAPEGFINRPIAVEFRQDLDGMVDITITDQLSLRRVRARLAADGDERAELSQRWKSRIEENNWIWGDGTEPSRTGNHDTTSLEIVGFDAEEAAHLFSSVLDAGEIPDVPPEVAAKLRMLAADGQKALGDKDHGLAKSRFEALSDLMFEHGVYL